MRHPSLYANAAKKATNVSLAEPLLAEAKELRINVSQAAEAGVARAVAEKRAEQWVRENREAFESSNAYVKKIRAAIGKVQDVLMPQYGVYRNPEGNGYVLDVQADVNSDFNTRVVVPLLPVHIAPKPA